MLIIQLQHTKLPLRIRLFAEVVRSSSHWLINMVQRIMVNVVHGTEQGLGERA